MPRAKKEKFSPRPWTRELVENYKIRCDRNKTLWFYSPETGLWSRNGESPVERIIRDQLLDPDDISSYQVREILSDLKSHTFTNEEFPSPYWYLIPFNNGVYDLKMREFWDFEPDHNFTSKLAIRYNPDNNGCPFIDEKLHELVEPEGVSDLYELAAYCMVPTYANQEVYFLLGSGRNGKSVYAYILTILLGVQHVSAVSLHDFQHNRFAGAELHGKFANISSELRYNDLNNTDQIKKLSGGDLIQAERKFQHPFNFENFAKLIFVTNELPRTMDKTNAFYRRVRIIRFPFSFEGSREDKLLKDKITIDELEGLAFKCISILHDMMERNFTFSRQSTTEDTAAAYERISNSLDTFIDEFCEHDAYGFIAKIDFKEKLDKWLRSTGQRVRTEKEISQYMRDKGIDDSRKQFVGNVRKNSWVGIQWRD